MRYEMTILLPKTDEKAANLLGLCLLRVTIISGLTVPAHIPGATSSPLSSMRPNLAPIFSESRD